MKTLFCVLVTFASVQAIAATLTCKPSIEDETIYNIKSLKVEIKEGAQKYKIREDKVEDQRFRTYLEQDVAGKWTLNKYEAIGFDREDLLAQVDMTCAASAEN